MSLTVRILPTDEPTIEVACGGVTRELTPDETAKEAWHVRQAAHELQYLWPLVRVHLGLPALLDYADELGRAIRLTSQTCVFPNHVGHQIDDDGLCWEEHP